MQKTVKAERIRIVFFGCRNVGKSSLVNAVTGQDLSVVSPVAGTTTDPVKKAMELLPLGPVLIMDTPGLDDEGMLGTLRVKKTRQALSGTDLAVLVLDVTRGLQKADEELIGTFQRKHIPYVLAVNKIDLCDAADPGHPERPNDRRDLAARIPGPALPDAVPLIFVSARTKEGVRQLKETLAQMQPEQEARKLVSDLIAPGDVVILVVPIDKAAPKGRLILPQQQVIRDVIESGASAVICRDTELAHTLGSLANPPRLVITDSQVFEKVAAMVPPETPLTSFSILFARFKGELDILAAGADGLDTLRDGDRVLIAEGCTHHRQCGDIGTEKMPRWIEDYTGKKLSFSFTSGGDFPDDLEDYALVVHCGGCMLTAKEMHSRMQFAADCGVPIVNYGAAIAKMHGILKRSLAVFDNADA